MKYLLSVKLLLHAIGIALPQRKVFPVFTFLSPHFFSGDLPLLVIQPCSILIKWFLGGKVILFKNHSRTVTALPFPTAYNAQYNFAPFSHYALKGKSPAATYCIVCMLAEILPAIKGIKIPNSTFLKKYYIIPKPCLERIQLDTFMLCS